jgi:hypothetical protein
MGIHCATWRGYRGAERIELEGCAWANEGLTKYEARFRAVIASLRGAK